MRISLLYSAHILLYELDDFYLTDRLEDIRTTAREESIDHGKARVLGRRSDECDDPFLYPWEEDILLGFTPSVYLIQEQYCLSPIFVVLLCFGNYFYYIFLFR